MADTRCADSEAPRPGLYLARVRPVECIFTVAAMREMMLRAPSGQGPTRRAAVDPNARQGRAHGGSILWARRATFAALTYGDGDHRVRLRSVRLGTVGLA
jgi:hypothetical protein